MTSCAFFTPTTSSLRPMAFGSGQTLLSIADWSRSDAAHKIREGTPMARQQSSGAALLFGVALVAGLYLTHDRMLNQEAPAFSLPETYGGSVDLASYRRQPVLLVFWMTSCGICRRELPLVSRMAPE